jgi:hypothetical protein
MRYLMLIVGDENQWTRLSEAERKAIYEQWGAYDAFLREGKHVLGGDELEPTKLACRIRMNAAGKLDVRDGPFTETKEVVGGYLVLEAKDKEEAIRLASRCPGLDRHGHVELYPIREYAG